MGRPWWHDEYWKRRNPRQRPRLPWRPILTILAILAVVALVAWARLS